MSCAQECTTDNAGALRLVDQTQYFEGSLEACNNEMWLPVCLASASSNTLQVVCRELGIEGMVFESVSNHYHCYCSSQILCLWY